MPPNPKRFPPSRETVIRKYPHARREWRRVPERDTGFSAIGCYRIVRDVGDQVVPLSIWSLSENAAWGDAARKLHRGIPVLNQGGQS